MNRRGFFKGVGAALGALGLRSRAAAKESPVHTVTWDTRYIVGFAMHAVYAGNLVVIQTSGCWPPSLAFPVSTMVLRAGSKLRKGEFVKLNSQGHAVPVSNGLLVTR